MGKITKEMTQAAYVSAKDVFHNKVKRSKALDQLENGYGINRGSAADYIVNFKKMMGGESYVRVMSTYSTDYILSQILIDYGYEKYSKAIQSVKRHIDYYEGLGKYRLNSTKVVLAKHENILANDSLPMYPDEILGNESLFEGVGKSIVVNSYERNPTARKKCLEHYGFQCAVCDFSFEEFYGSIGVGYIQVHHLIPVANIRESYQIDPIKDLRPICPNCHAMLHKENPPLTIEDLQQRIKMYKNVGNT